VFTRFSVDYVNQQEEWTGRRGCWWRQGWGGGAGGRPEMTSRSDARLPGRGWLKNGNLPGNPRMRLAAEQRPVQERLADRQL